MLWSVPVAPRSLYIQASEIDSSQHAYAVPGIVSYLSASPECSMVFHMPIRLLYIRPKCYHLVAAKVTRLQVPRHTRQLHHQAIQFFAHTHLAAQSRGLSQAESEIQHIVLVVARLLHLIKHLLSRNDDVAGRASA